jgi:hypothetical protein
MIIVSSIQMVDDFRELRNLFGHLVMQVRVFCHGWQLLANCLAAVDGTFTLYRGKIGTQGLEGVHNAKKEKLDLPVGRYPYHNMKGPKGMVLPNTTQT